MKNIAIAALFLTASAQAVPPLIHFQRGDVIVASVEPACAVDPPPPAVEQIVLHGRDAARVRDLSSALVSTARYAEDGIYVASPQSIDFLTKDGGLIPLVGIPAGARATALGGIGDDVLAIVYRGAEPQLWRMPPLRDTEVTALPQYDHSIDAIDLAADRCTLFYSALDSIERFDICAKRPLATFAHLFVTGFRILPDAGVIVASGRDLIRFDARGNRIAQFTLTSGNEGIGAIALDTNPSLLWLVTTFGCGTGASRVMQISIATGTITAGPQRASRSGGFAIAVQGEWRAAIDAPPRRRAVR